jgi:superfamily I DNA/RNA helicase
MSWLCKRSDFDLHQQEILTTIFEDRDYSWWIRGYAGTGKTMLLAYLTLDYFEEGLNCAYATYTHALKNRIIEGMTEVIGHRIPTILTVDELLSKRQKFDVVLLDEVQDLSFEQVQNLVNRGERLILSGDINQSVFRHAIHPSKLERLLGNPEIVELKDIHRMPEAISWASHLIYEEAESAEDAEVNVLSNSTVSVVKASSVDDEINWVFQQALKEATPGKPSVVLFSTHEQIRIFAKQLFIQQGFPNFQMEERGSSHKFLNNSLRMTNIPVKFFGGVSGDQLGDANNKKLVLLMTIQSAKGLEFNSVFMPFMTSDRNPTPYRLFSSGEEDEWRRRFMYMAITRAQLNFYASYTGEPSSYFELLDTPEMRKKYLKLMSI